MSAFAESEVADKLAGNTAPRTPSILVIGIGNAYRSDDAIGLMAARRIKEQALEDCSAIEHTGEGTALIELWKGADRVIVIDAMRSGTAPGNIGRFDATLQPLPATMHRDSTHAFGLAEAIELSRTLQLLPRQLIVYGVEAQSFAAGTNLSLTIELAIVDVVERVRREISPNAP